MNIFRKRKIEKCCNAIYDEAMKITNNLGVIVSKYGYKDYIFTNNESFVSVSFMFVFYFFDILLKGKYKYDDDTRYVIISCLIGEMDSHLTKSNVDVAMGAYMDLAKCLTNIPDEYKGEDINPYWYASVLYLTYSLNNKFYSDKLTDDEYGDLLQSVSTEFSNILNNEYKF